MKILLNIEANSAEELQNAIREIWVGTTPVIELPVSAETKEPAIEKTTRSRKQVVPVAAPVAKPVEEPTPTAEPVQEPDAEPTAPTITLEQVREKLANLSRAGKTPEVKALIATFGVTKLTDIPAEKYTEVMTAAEAIV
jgi:hypothetical protein